MEVPVGFRSSIWGLIRFLPFFFLLLVLGLVKAALFGDIVAGIIFAGNSAVVLGLWPAHAFWTTYAVVRTKRLGLLLKILVLLLLPVPLVLWLILSIVGSLLVGISYGLFAPLAATLQAVGAKEDRLYHCLMDGSWSAIKRSCTFVRDFTDLCFHSYFSLMDDMIKDIGDDDWRLDVKLSMVPGMFLVSMLAVAIDVPMITLVALVKSPFMLLRGWQRLLQDLIGREGPFLESVCVPFAALAIILWPIAVSFAFVGAIFAGFLMGLYGGIVVHQENSLRMGLAYIVSAVALFDEYTNDFLYLQDGSCLPRPKYRKHAVPHSGQLERGISLDKRGREHSGSFGEKLASVGSRRLKDVEVTVVQLWDWLFQSCETNGRMLIQDGLLTVQDIEECLHKGRCKKLTIRLPGYCILQCLLRSAKSDTSGLLLTEDMELTLLNSSRDRFLKDWFLRPLLIIKEQIKGLHLDDNEMHFFNKLIMTCDSEKLEDWSYGCFPSDDNIRKAQLQAIVRRTQGIVTSLSRMPTFRRRFHDLIRTLYLESKEETGMASSKHDLNERADPESSSRTKGVDAIV
ncbi:putative membrane protein [Nymphaea thermarum]|nr:putative membrane protein [Nymphaea thermarum]